MNLTPIVFKLLEFRKWNENGDVTDGEVSGFTVDRAFVPVFVDLSFQEDDVAFLERQLGGVFSVEVVDGAARRLNRRSAVVGRSRKGGRNCRVTPSFVERWAVLGSTSRETEKINYLPIRASCLKSLYN